ncbi:hypothetical protein [Streptomyces sp. NPDC093707]|uniref:hypothetical protein n=1 Tax=Streptomyces sp. NPDC093707 TaxID=3154984 RepID=UPI00344E536A
MGRRLATAVHVQHPTSREWVVLEPGDEPAEELAAEIPNPGAWEDEEPAAGEPKGIGFTGSQPEPDPEREAAPPAPRRRRKTAEADE